MSKVEIQEALLIEIDSNDDSDGEAFEDEIDVESYIKFEEVNQCHQNLNQRDLGGAGKSHMAITSPPKQSGEDDDDIDGIETIEVESHHQSHEVNQCHQNLNQRDLGGAGKSHMAITSPPKQSGKDDDDRQNNILNTFSH